MKLRRTLAILLVLALAVSGLAACGGSTSGDGESQDVKEYPDQGVTKDTVKVGTFLALSGPGASLGVPIKKGIESYIAYVNENGGVNGRQIEYIIEDDAYDPAKSIAVTKKLVEQDKVLCVGPALGAAGTLAVKDYLLSNHVPMVHPMNGSSKVALPIDKYLFPVQPLYTNEAAFMVKFGKEKLESKKIAVIYENGDYGKEGLEGVKKAALDNGLEIVYEGAVEGKDIDFSTQVMKSKEAGADTVVVYGILNLFSGIVKEAQQQSYAPYFITFYPNLDIRMYELGGDAVTDKVYVTGWIPNPDPNDPKYQEFVEIYKKNNGGEAPSGLATAGFVGAEIIVEGIKRAGEDLNRDTFIAALETFDGFTGIQAPPVTYGENVRMGVTTMQMYQAKGGEFVPITQMVDLRDLSIEYRE